MADTVSTEFLHPFFCPALCHAIPRHPANEGQFRTAQVCSEMRSWFPFREILTAIFPALLLAPQYFAVPRRAQPQFSTSLSSYPESLVPGAGIEPALPLPGKGF